MRNQRNSENDKECKKIVNIYGKSAQRSEMNSFALRPLFVSLWGVMHKKLCTKNRDEKRTKKPFCVYYVTLEGCKNLKSDLNCDYTWVTIHFFPSLRVTIFTKEMHKNHGL